jgi:hypothetical protein
MKYKKRKLQLFRCLSHIFIGIMMRKHPLRAVGCTSNNRGSVIPVTQP